jgi:hypothetical protein
MSAKSKFASHVPSPKIRLMCPSNSNPVPPIRIVDQTRTATKADGTQMRVVDAEFSFLLQPSAEDIANAVPLDHSRCMYCLACARQFGSELVWVTRTLAYVELKNKQGKPELVRFILTAPAREKIKEFDSGKQSVTPQAVVFAAPKKTQRLDSNYKRKQAANKKRQRAAYLKGTIKKRDHKLRPVSEALRDPATGMFHFTVTGGGK